MKFGLAIITLVVLFIAWKQMKKQAGQKALDLTNLVPNDKLVLVEDVSETDMKKILQDFCNSYNEDSVRAVPRLHPLSENKFAVTFPYNISFDLFCYFINYVNYPTDFERSFKTLGWATTASGDAWINAQNVNKKVMLYLSETDTEYDNVFMTTADNQGFKMGFAIREQNQALEKPEQVYIPQPVNLTDLEEKPYNDFR